MAVLLLGLHGCGGGSEAEREWRPSDHGQPRGAPQGGAVAPTAAPQDKEGGEARAARSLWNVTCAGCHGPDGRGGGADLPPGAKAPDLRSAVFHAERTDAVLAKSIRDGQGMMPAFGKQLGDAGIRALVAHVRTLAPPQGAQGPSGVVTPPVDAGAKPTPPAAP